MPSSVDVIVTTFSKSAWSGASRASSFYHSLLSTLFSLKNNPSQYQPNTTTTIPSPCLRLPSFARARLLLDAGMSPTVHLHGFAHPFTHSHSLTHSRPLCLDNYADSYFHPKNSVKDEFRARQHTLFPSIASHQLESQSRGATSCRRSNQSKPRLRKQIKCDRIS